jgi:hypothetical protein
MIAAAVVGSVAAVVAVAVSAAAAAGLFEAGTGRVDDAVGLQEAAPGESADEAGLGSESAVSADVCGALGTATVCAASQPSMLSIKSTAEAETLELGAAAPPAGPEETI